ncbi:MAG: hypothetical protein R2754_15510 [Microthrixaceae bacterium]
MPTPTVRIRAATPGRLRSSGGHTRKWVMKIHIDAAATSATGRTSRRGSGISRTQISAKTPRMMNHSRSGRLKKPGTIARQIADVRRRWPTVRDR